MASGASPSSFRLNSVDRHGRRIDPAVLAAAETVFPRALEYGTNLLGDAAVVANTLEEVAASVSQLMARRDPPVEPAPIRNLPGYIFRAFVREVNRLKNKELAVLDAAIAGQTLAQRLADPLRQLEMKILVNECLAQFDFAELLKWTEVGRKSAAQIETSQRWTAMQPTTGSGNGGVESKPMLLGLCNPSVNRCDASLSY